MSSAFNGTAAVRGALLMTASTYVTYALGLLASVLVARAIGPEEFGRYSYIVWLSGSLTMLANNGLNTTGIRFISECLGRGEADSAQRVHGWLLRLQWACVAIVLVAFVALLPYFLPSGWTGSLVLLVCVVGISMGAKAFYLFGISTAKGYGNFGIEPATTVTISLANAGLVIVLLLSGASLTAFLWLFALAGVGHVTITTLLLRRARLVPGKGEIEESIRIRLRQHLLWTVILTGVSVLSNGSVATWLLNRLVGSAEVGYFVIAGALTRGGVDLLSSGLTTVLMPLMAHAFGEKGKAGVSSILCDAFRYFQFLGLLLAGAGSLVAPAIVDLAYGPGYQPVVRVVVILVIVGGVALSEGAFGAVLSTTDNQRLRAGFSVFSVAVSAALAFALIPGFGLDGAVAAFASSRLLVFLVLVVSVSRFMELRLPFREAILLGISALIAGTLSLGLLFGGNAWWWYFLAGIVYAIVFVTCTVVLGAWKTKDVVVVASLIARYPRMFGAIRPAIDRWATRLADRDRESDSRR